MLVVIHKLIVTVNIHKTHILGALIKRIIDERLNTFELYGVSKIINIFDPTQQDLQTKPQGMYLRVWRQDLDQIQTFELDTKLHCPRV